MKQLIAIRHYRTIYSKEMVHARADQANTQYAAHRFRSSSAEHNYLRCFNNE